MKKTKSVQKLITFPRGLYEKLMVKAEKSGVGFSDYVRYLSINYVESSSRDNVAFGSEQESALENAMQDLKEGRYKDYKNVDDLIKDLHSATDEK